MARQDFDSASERLLQYTGEYEARGGYAGAYVRQSQRRVDLYWKGPLPESLVALVEELKPYCSVQVLPAAHDVVELRRAHDRLTSAPGIWSSGIVGVALENDGSGLVLVHEGDEPPREFLEQLGLDVTIKWERGSAPEPPILHG